MISVNSQDLASDQFTTRGIRSTRQRRAIYEMLMATKAHPTAEAIYHQVREICPGISLATIYNTLEAFTRCGLVQKIPGPDGSARYDGTVDHHPHLRVESTGQVLDLPEEMNAQWVETLQRDLLTRVESELHFQVRQVRIEIVGEYR